MSETLAEFAARYDGIHPENGDDIWTFARDAWAAIKAEVDRQKTEAERTPLATALLAACKTALKLIESEIGKWPQTAADLRAVIKRAEAERTPEPAPVVCVRCRKPIEREGDMYYLGGEGIVHVACVPRSERKSPGSPVSLDKDAADALAAIITQHCSPDPRCSAFLPGPLNSRDNEEYADAMRLLARARYLVIDSDDGKNRVIGHWAAKPEEKAERKVKT